MSEVVTLADAVTTGTIYGTLAGAIAKIKSKFGARYRAWISVATADEQKQTLISAADYINTRIWNSDYDTFAERDALQAFVDASYELAVLAYEDEDVLALPDTSSNLSRVYAGGAGVDFANPTSIAAGTAEQLPPILMALIGQYLGSTGGATVVGGIGSSGGCRNPLSDCADYDRKRPF